LPSDGPPSDGLSNGGRPIEGDALPTPGVSSGGSVPVPSDPGCKSDVSGSSFKGGSSAGALKAPDAVTVGR
jgi:hypothetical protein